MLVVATTLDGQRTEQLSLTWAMLTISHMLETRLPIYLYAAVRFMINML